MIRKASLLIAVPSLVCLFLSCASSAPMSRVISEFKQSDVGRDFLKNHSEEDLEVVLSFQRDPLHNFRDVQRVADVCSYIYAYANYLAETKQKDEAGYMDFYKKYFEVATDENVPILTYLVLNCHNAFLMESIVGHYTELFAAAPEIFVRDLKLRANWKQIVDEARAGDWQIFKEAVAKLGNSGFELELKKYALSVSR